jgi:hypothetical protein
LYALYDQEKEGTVKIFIQYQSVRYVVFILGLNLCSVWLHGAGMIQQNAQVGLYGNWVKKREWQNLAEQHLAEIDDVIVAMETYNIEKYQPKYDLSDKQCNDFYRKIGVSSEAVSSLLDEVYQEMLDKLQKSLDTIKDPDQTRLDAEQKTFQLERDIKRLDIEMQQLKLDIQLVEDFDKNITARRNQVETFLSMAQGKKTESYKLFQELKQLLDDKKAREKYYMIKGSLDQLKSLQTFFTTIFFNESDELIKNAAQQMQQVENAIKQLEEKGAVINDRAKVLEQLKIKAHEEEQQKKEREEEAERLRKQKKVIPFSHDVTVFDQAKKFFAVAWFTVVEIVSDVKKWFYGLVGITIEEQRFGRPQKKQKDDQIEHAAGTELQKKSNIQAAEQVKSEKKEKKTSDKEAAQNIDINQAAGQKQ